jgi:hypothetical protein
MVFAVDGPFHIVWATAMNVDDVLTWHDDVMAFLARTERPAAVCMIVPTKAPPPSAPMRAALGKSIDEMSNAGAYSGCILLGTGFAASVQRSVVAALGLLTVRNERAMKVADSAASFLARLPPELRAHGDAFHALVAQAEKAATPAGRGASPST